jgi:hypothetical protein
VIGGFRGFTDKTQFFLLNAILYAGLFTAFYALLDFVLNAGFMIIKHKQHIKLQSIIFLLIGLFSFIFSAAAAAILTLSEGNMK